MPRNKDLKALRGLLRLLGTRSIPVLGLMLFAGLTEGFGLLLLIPMLQFAGFPLSEGVAGQASEMITRAFEALGVAPSLALVLALYVLFIVGSHFLNRVSTVRRVKLHQQITAKLRKQLYSLLTRANWLFFVRSRSSDFTHMLTTELSRVSGLTSSLLSLAVALVHTSAYLIAAFLLSPQVTLLVLACGTALLALLSWKSNVTRRKGGELTTAYQGMFAVVSDQLAGVKTSKSHGSEEFHVEMFSKASDSVQKADAGVLEHQAEVTFWFQAGSVITLAMVVYTSLAVLSLPAAAIALLLVVYGRLIPMFSSLQGNYMNILAELPAYEGLLQLEERAKAAAEETDSGQQVIRVREGIELANVSFGYGEDPSSTVVRSVDLAIPLGHTVAIVGPSGGGKSTIADIVIGLLEPDAGQVLIDGEPRRPELLGSFRQQIGYVAQDAFIFNDTIRVNLLLTKPRASEEELVDALTMASAHFVFGLPDGLDTVLGDRGVRLSGGERQRLALARALLRRPALLVLDEATSSLDARNERHIQEAIERLHGQMMILVIAHRLATVRNADAIYLVEAGRIVETGSWQELVARPGGRFRALYEAQRLSGVGSPS